ncbi:BBT_HP_G0132200.mRNA.1.CDS.1 [Saccharomyces cerevisiae]|nr:BBT_HP_G0132200.mRNA.1.CDS.1 [Saccharomyces cerevisiae]CAI6975867.1 BBT_HP_G0132200.mRNA.1.CDS.1 [Saccharomyces cerevisiae]
MLPKKYRTWSFNTAGNGNKIKYYHIEWTHTSRIVKDLSFHGYLLCIPLIRKARKYPYTVSVERYYGLSLNDAYNKLKDVAKDISPNMGLIFQLMEWGTMLSKNSPGEEGETVTCLRKMTSETTKFRLRSPTLLRP